jgi:diadenylate cyclase
MEKIIDKIVSMWNNIDISYLFQLITLIVLYYIVFKVLKANKSYKMMAIMVLFVVLFGLSCSLSDRVNSQMLFVVICLVAVLVVMMFSVEIKRSLLDSGAKHHSKKEGLTVRHIEIIVDETIRAIQHMSKNDIGALIVLSNENLPEGIIASGTIINAEINAPMIEAVFYPKAPLHDGAMIIEGDKIHAAGCFLPIIQNENLPQEIGSRHRAALGVTTVASVTAIVVSEETGIISIVKNGEIKKRYAGDVDLKKALNEYYWSDISSDK